MLRYKFAKNETVRWQVVQEAKVSTTMAANMQTAQTESRSVKIWKVKEIKDNGDVVFVHSVDKVLMRQKLTGRAEVVYDSESTDPPPAGFEQAASNVGIPLTEVTMNPTGAVVDRNDLKEQYRPGGDSPMTIPLSEEPIKVGDRWHQAQTITVKLKSGLEKAIKCRQQFTLKSVKDRIAVIQMETVVLEPVHDPAIEAQLVQQATKGTIRFDIAAGRVIEQQMDISERVVGAFGPASSFQFEMKFHEQLVNEKGDAIARVSNSTTGEPPKKK
ncbi:MAG: hypothetical protein MPJ50_15025 [Pirellulales bacterium]|nr:hypothetical protein [Pirellulales bacterium]